MSARQFPSMQQDSYDATLVAFHLAVAMLQFDGEASSLVQLVIVHRYATLPGYCTPGEEIAAAYLVRAGKTYRIPLSTAHLILLDYMARHQRVPQTAAQIARGLSNELFYLHHASNARGEQVMRPRTSRVAVKEQVMRIRDSIALCLEGAQILLDPSLIISSMPTTTNEVLYQLQAKVRWEHHYSSGSSG